MQNETKAEMFRFANKILIVIIIVILVLVFIDHNYNENKNEDADTINSRLSDSEMFEKK